MAASGGEGAPSDLKRLEAQLQAVRVDFEARLQAERVNLEALLRVDLEARLQAQRVDLEAQLQAERTALADLDARLQAERTARADTQGKLDTLIGTMTVAMSGMADDVRRMRDAATVHSKQSRAMMDTLASVLAVQGLSIEIACRAHFWPLLAQARMACGCSRRVIH